MASYVAWLRQILVDDVNSTFNVHWIVHEIMYLKYKMHNVLHAINFGYIFFFKATPEIILVTRYFLHAIPLVPMLLYKPEMLVFENKWNYLLVILGGTFKGLESLCTYYSYQYIPLLDSMVLSNSQPIFVAIISFLWLKESIGVHEIYAMIITMIGVILVCEPTFIFGSETVIDPVDRLIGSGIALMSAVYTALCTCITRRLFDINLCVIIYTQGIMSVLIGFILGTVSGTLVLPIKIFDIVAMILVGILGMLSRAFVTQSLKTEDATIISVLQSIRTPLLFVFQWTVIAEQPSVLATIGAILVTVSSILLALKKQIAKVTRKPMRAIKQTVCCGRDVCRDDEEEENLLKESSAERNANISKRKRLESFYASLEL